MRFECVIDHGVKFLEFKKLCYNGLEEVWVVDPDY